MRLTFALAGLLLSSPVLAGNSGASAELARGFSVASQRAALAEAAVEELQVRLERMEARLQELSGGGGGSQALDTEVSGLRGDMEEVRFALDQLTTDFQAWQLDQERRQLHDESRLRQLEELLAVEPPAAPSLTGASGGPVAPEPVPEVAPEPVDPDPEPAPVEGEETDVAAQLAVAQERMEAGQQAAARSILERALETSPDDPLAAELRYRIAETRYNEGQWKQAARSFQQVTDHHPRSPWAPWAMLRIGECFEGMGRDDAAKTFYDGVMRNFPNSDAAREAKGRL